MPGLGLFLSEDLEALVGRYVERQTPGENPLARTTVVVPNAAVGQWFEQAVARATGRPGHDDGVVANVDAIFPSGLLGRVLYGDHRALEAWGATALALELRAQGGIDLRESLSRARVLESLVQLRGEDLDDRLEAAGLERERRLVGARAARGLLTPHDQWRRHGVGFADFVGPRVTVVACAAAAWSGLLVEACVALADARAVDVYLPVASEGLLGELDDGLGARWGAPARARVERWTQRATPQWVDAASTAPRVGGAARVPVGARVEVHRCVGRARQVEVARDLLLGDSDVAAHRVRIVTPDPRTVVPLLSLYLTPFEEGPSLQFEVAEPVIERPAPRLDALRALLAAGESDLTIRDVLALVDEPALRRGVGLDHGDAERAMRLALEGRVSLGLSAHDPSRRGAFAREDDAGSWSRWVDRVALAAVFEPERLLEPDDVATLGGPEDLEVAARVEALLSTLRDVVGRRAVRQPLRGWIEDLRRWSGVIDDDPRVREPSLERVLATLEALSDGVELEYSELRDLIEDLAQGLGGATLLGRGGAAVVPFVGTAALPFEVTCVVGLDDALSAPRRAVEAMGERRATDPDPGADLRDALLTLLASTRGRLLVMTDGQRIVDGGELEPALLVSELLEALGAAGVEVLVADHPRHGFSVEGAASPDLAAVAEAALTTDVAHEAVAAALAGPRDGRSALWTVPGEAPEEPVVEASRLVSFLVRPQREFLRDVFTGARVLDERDQVPDAPLLDLGDARQRWAMRRALLERAIATGERPEPARGPDSALGTVAAGMRASAEAGLDLDDLHELATSLRETLASAAAAREARFEVAGRAVGRRHEVTRGPLEVYRTPKGLFLVRPVANSSFERQLVGAAVDLAVATVEVGEAVTGVLVRPRRREERASAPPAAVLRWREGVDGARQLLAEVLALYAQRWRGLPRHLHTTSLALGAEGHAAWTKLFGSAKDAWHRPGFQGNEERGESLEAEIRLTLPFDFDELVALDEGVVVEASARLFGAISRLNLALVDDGSWATLLRAP
jgi:hypothetical protein